MILKESNIQNQYLQVWRWKKNYSLSITDDNGEVIKRLIPSEKSKMILFKSTKDRQKNQMIPLKQF